MKKLINVYSLIAILALGVITVGMYSGCKPEKFGDGNGLTSPDLNAAFTVTPVSGKANYYVLKASASGVLGVKWDLGDGGGANVGKTIDTVFFPDAGTYNVVLTAIGKGGATKTASQTITVATSDPNSGNLVLGGHMGPEDDAKWSHITISSGVTMTLADGKMTAMGGNYGHAAVYQAIHVEANKKYKVDMIVSGSGATDTWFEVYVGTTVPANGTDYSDGGARQAINTWTGCGKTAFNGKLSAIQCAGNGNVVSFPTSGTVYLLIKSGGSNLGVTGISFTNVELRGTN